MVPEGRRDVNFVDREINGEGNVWSTAHRLVSCYRRCRCWV